MKLPLFLAETDGEPHNTITPIAKKKGDMYEAGSYFEKQYYHRGEPAGRLSSSCTVSPYQEREHWSYRGYGACSTSGKIKKEELELLAEYS